MGASRRKCYCRAMEDDSENNGNFPQETAVASEELPKDSEGVRSGSEGISEPSRPLRNHAERSKDHTIPVRGAAKIFEEAKLPVTERTIINWCNPNKRGIVRLDCYFDAGDGKYFITPQSIEQVIKEESPRAKATHHIPFNLSENQGGISELDGKGSEEQPTVSEEVPKDSETGSESFGSVAGESMGNGGNKEQVIRQLRQNLIDGTILNKGKDFFIEQLQKDRVIFANERQDLIHQMVLQGERVGKLETQLRQLQAPRQNGEAHSQAPNHVENNEEESGQHEGWQAE